MQDTLFLIIETFHVFGKVLYPIYANPRLNHRIVIDFLSKNPALSMCPWIIWLASNHFNLVSLRTYFNAYKHQLGY